ADQQSRRTYAPQRRAVAQTRLRLPERERLPIRRTHPDRDTDAPPATAQHLRVSPPSHRRPPYGPAGAQTRKKAVNGYDIITCRDDSFLVPVGTAESGSG